MSVILHSVNTKDDKYYPEAYMEEYKYERTEETSYILILILSNNLFKTYK